MSGSTIGGVVGATIGFFVGSPQLGWMIGSAIGGYVDPDVIEGPRLKDAQVQTSQEGVPRPIIYGTAQVAGNLIHRGPLREVKKKERTGKGGPVQETYHYYMTYAIRVCEGPVVGIRRIWRDDKLVYSTREGDSLDADSAAFASKLTIYTGSETQLPDPSLEALPAEYNGGVGNVPSYLGTCYVVFENDDLTERRGTIPQYRFEVVSEGAVTAGTSSASWLATNGAGIFQSSPDGTDWQSQPKYTVAGFKAHRMLWGKGALTISGPDFDSTHKTVYSLDRGASFTQAQLDGSPARGQGDDLKGNFFAGSFWYVGTSADRKSVFRSSDGQAYQTLPVPDPSTRDVSDVGGTGAFTLVALGNAVGVTSDSGGTWTFIDTAGGSSISADVVGSNGSRIMLAGFVATTLFVRYTDDGQTFSSRYNLTELSTVRAIKGAGSTWVLTGSGGIAYSLDGGDSFVKATLPSGAENFEGRGIEYGDGLWVVVGRIGTVAKVLTATDPNGTWTVRNTNLVSGEGELKSVVRMSCDGYAMPDAPGFYVSDDGTICGGSLGTITPGAVTLASIVTDLCSRVGVTASQLDVSELTDIVTGFVVARQMPAAEAIRSLQQGYRFDFPEWDLKLRGIKRGGAIKVTITGDDLIGDEEEVRAQAVEFPRKLHLLTADPEANYEAVKETSERLTDNVKAVGETSMELPIIFASADERAQVCDILHKVAWTEAMGRVELELPEEFSYLCPSDCFDFHAKRWRITKTELMDGSLKVEAARDRVSAYTSGATGTANTPTAPVSSVKGPTLFQAMNLPSLRTQDNQPGVYLAATGLLDAWNGCAVYLSVDGGVTEQLVASISGRATMGKLTAAIDADDGTTGQPAIPVWLYNAEELDSITTAQMDAGLNGFAIGSSGVWEVGQFQTATFADPDWELSDALRGELDTVAAAHVADDPFVLLDDNIVFLPIDASFAGKTLIFRAVTNGTVPENNPTFEMVFDPPTYIIDGGGA